MTHTYTRVTTDTYSYTQTNKQSDRQSNRHLFQFIPTNHSTVIAQRETLHKHYNKDSNTHTQQYNNTQDIQ